ncbi:sensor histidine kinase [Paenibacillus hexagrammi]|uniref:histidine kinase n=1 Tax=Paenibacillus hexagrammi TaxID=2908839 RepID=A0ABY3SI40_9BACL|nr:ATP-binding protein [Paenibacillus sp. YPD9-1]UJF33572.1 ATP-binding protein [Paenibacillus sp. YPD9-1]
MSIYLKKDGMQMLLVALLTAIAGEFKIMPFSGEVFRIGLGSSAFLLCLLLLKHLPYVLTGIVTGISVILFRTCEDAVVLGGKFESNHALQVHFSAALYYVVFAAILSFMKYTLHRVHPLILGTFISVADLLSNESELLVRSLIFHLPFMYPGQWLVIVVTAVVRSFFVVGIYSSISISQMRELHAEQQKHLEHLLSTNSGLYGEVFYLRKSMNTIEQITAKSHDLYGKAGKAGDREVARSILEITQQIHEVKKDSQRILAGLLKLFDKETAPDMRLSEVLEFVVRSNKKYSGMLGKKIQFHMQLQTDYGTLQHIPLLTVLNNLVANAVEAVEEQGAIRIEAHEREDMTILIVADNGDGIAEQEKALVFEPGYTTKYNIEGIAATGIGLSHVRDIVESFGGRISLESSPGKETIFAVELRTDVIRKGE